MLIEIGPVRRASAEAWLAYARGVLVEMDRRRELSLDPSARSGFARLVEQWSAVLDSSPGDFAWSEEETPEEVEFLIRALYLMGRLVEEEHEAGRMELRPAEADDFHRAVVRQVLAEMEQEGPAAAQFVACLRDEWGVAGDS